MMQSSSNIFLSHKSTNYHDFFQIYTDGSRCETGTSYAVVTQEADVFSCLEARKLPEICTIFTAELYAIYRAVKIINVSSWDKAVVFSDSLGALQAIKGTSTICHYLTKLQHILATTKKLSF